MVRTTLLRGTVMRRIRCAIYTRKSSEDGLDQDFNSLDAQREACEAYIVSQRHEGWELLPEHYDDGGISGGHLDRPGLQRLMRAVDAKQVDQIVVYKIDRLTRSLADFAKLVDRLDVAETSFVSVTQSFNTATSMGRLTLNMLLSFAQFEREVTAERIRDKIAASKRKGMWLGGNVPLGYDADGRTLKINEVEATTIKRLYALYFEHGNMRDVQTRAESEGLRSKLRQRPSGKVTGGKSFSRGQIQHLLSNPVYAGRIRHKGQVHDGLHEAIVAPDVWEKAQQMLIANSSKERGAKHTNQASPLAGKLFDETGDRLTPSHSRKNGKRLRYYISQRLVTDRSNAHPSAWRLPANQLETTLANAVAKTLRKPDAALEMTVGPDAKDVQQIAEKLHQDRTTKQLLKLIERVDLGAGDVTIRLGEAAVSRLLDRRDLEFNTSALRLELPFQTRRRGVELKLHLGDVEPEIDHTLVQNIVKAHRYLTLIKEGQTFTEIAAEEGVSKRRIQDLTNLALLAPDIIAAITSGETPPGLTTDYLIKNRFSANWSEQHAQFAAL